VALHKDSSRTTRADSRGTQSETVVVPHTVSVSTEIYVGTLSIKCGMCGAIELEWARNKFGAKIQPDQSVVFSRDEVQMR
jgi:hypothetical protein